MHGQDASPKSGNTYDMRAEKRHLFFEKRHQIFWARYCCGVRPACFLKSLLK